MFARTQQLYKNNCTYTHEQKSYFSVQDVTEPIWILSKTSLFKSAFLKMQRITYRYRPLKSTGANNNILYYYPLCLLSDQTSLVFSFLWSLMKWTWKTMQVQNDVSVTVPMVWIKGQRQYCFLSVTQVNSLISNETFLHMVKTQWILLLETPTA